MTNTLAYSAALLFTSVEKFCSGGPGCWGENNSDMGNISNLCSFAALIFRLSHEDAAYAPFISSYDLPFNFFFLSLKKL